MVGLQARLATAIASNLHFVAHAGGPPQVVASVADMKLTIAQILCSGGDEGVDLGNHHDVFQFLPYYRRDIKMVTLLTNHTYLRHHAFGHTWGATGPPHDVNNWPDIVNYLQALQITRANAAVGPVDLTHYFNL